MMTFLFCLSHILVGCLFLSFECYKLINDKQFIFGNVMVFDGGMDLLITSKFEQDFKKLTEKVIDNYNYALAAQFCSDFIYCFLSWL